MAAATTTTSAFHKFLASNKTWHKTTASNHPDLFPSLAKGQAPPLLWLGCSDSRCPETTLCGAQPGDIFVHRNIANVVSPHDMSSQSVIYYAINALKVSDVVVCGHTSCGGVAAALGNGKIGGTLDAWLYPLRELRAGLAKTEEGWDGLGDKEKAVKLVEANVKRGVGVVRRNPEVVKAVEERGVGVHGVVFDVGTGELREVDCGEGEEEVREKMDCFKIG